MMRLSNTERKEMTTETCKCPVCDAPATLNDAGFQCSGCKMTLPVDHYNRLLERFADTARLDAIAANQWRLAQRPHGGKMMYLVNGWQAQYSNWHDNYRDAIDEAIKVIS